jgi:SHS2 domain-containing protein
MKKMYKFLEHPADIGLESTGKNLMETFENAAYGLYEIMVDIPHSDEDITKEFDINAKDLDSLLVKFLTEILYYFEVDEFIGTNIHVLSILQKNDEYYLKAQFKGISFEKEKHIFKTGVKAVTFHQLEIKNNNEIFTAKVFFDI